MTWENFWMAVLAIVVMAVLVVASFVTFSDKRVDDYYLGLGPNGQTCVYAHWTWEGDSRAYCSDDISRIAVVLQGAKDSLGKGGTNDVRPIH